MSGKSNKYCQKALIFDLRSFALHDGPGIRTTVFFKGCPLNCCWCHNPEGIRAEKEIVFRANLCRFGQHQCLVKCKRNAVSMYNGRLIFSDNCNLCGECVAMCPSGAITISGKYYSVSELIAEIEKEALFFKHSGGGITFSGGEPLMQAEFLSAVLKEIKKSFNWHTVVDTSGYGSRQAIESILNYTDLFLFDFKIMNQENHKKFTGVFNRLILDNFEFLVKNRADLIIRIPLIPEATATENNLRAIADYLSSFGRVFNISLLNFNPRAEGKYVLFNRRYNYPGIRPFNEQQLQQFSLPFEKAGFKVLSGE